MRNQAAQIDRNAMAGDAGGFETRYVVATRGGPTAEAADWVETATVEDKTEAISMAGQLFESGSYDRVSVRKTFFDEQKRQPVTIDIRIFGGREFSLSLPALLVLSLFGGIASFLLTYFMVTM